MPGIWHQAGCCCGGPICGPCGYGITQPSAFVTVAGPSCAGANGVYHFTQVNLSYPHQCDWYWAQQPGVPVGTYRLTVTRLIIDSIMSYCAWIGRQDPGVFRKVFDQPYGDPCYQCCNVTPDVLCNLETHFLEGTFDLGGNAYCPDSIATVSLNP